MIRTATLEVKRRGAINPIVSRRKETTKTGKDERENIQTREDPWARSMSKLIFPLLREQMQAQPLTEVVTVNGGPVSAGELDTVGCADYPLVRRTVRWWPSKALPAPPGLPLPSLDQSPEVWWSSWNTPNLLYSRPLLGPLPRTSLGGSLISS